ncbi:hypothetical protein IPV69_02005 [Humisphaera borealis]|uniref:Sulfotransferase family protein n=2 Tax=Humisphaera borealis TaxID=2807512 RepID=A0A7M2WXP3_9BACT|nr:hypothetical protein IPV69_02005 [Humisphaera borealis]
MKIRHNIHMNANYPDTRICVQEEGEDLRYYTDKELADFDLISGHFGFAIRRRLEADRHCITILREPISRIISGYHYWRTLVDTPLGNACNSMDIYQFSQSLDPTVIEFIDNAQTWQLFWDYTTAARRRFEKIPPSEVLATARKNLRSFDFVGVQENMPGVLSTMATRFNWRWTDDVADRINSSPNPKAAGEVDLKRLRESLGSKVRLDDELYQLALQLFRKAH